jgi:glucose/arabinose dehydrogenase
VFIAFHGSWNRAPEPQAGYRVVFQPIRNGRAAGPYETFADGFSPNSGGSGPYRRPGGLAVGPDGALYIADDATGRIWKVVYTGG